MMNQIQMKENRKNKNLIVLIVVLCVALSAILFYFLALPYIKAEYFTLKYGDQFKDLYSQTNMIDDVEFFRVFEYSETSAKAYYVETDRLTTNYVYFSRDNVNGQWEMSGWETIWSKYGSASGASWPYYFKDYIK